MAGKLRPETWADLPRMSKIAAAMYPDKVPEHCTRNVGGKSRTSGCIAEPHEPRQGGAASELRPRAHTEAQIEE